MYSGRCRPAWRKSHIGTDGCEGVLLRPAATLTNTWSEKAGDLSSATDATRTAYPEDFLYCRRDLLPKLEPTVATTIPANTQ